MPTFIRYIEVYFTFALVDYVRYNEDFVKSRFYSVHFTVILAGLKKIVRYIIPRTSLYRSSLSRGSRLSAAGFALTFEFLRTL